MLLLLLGPFWQIFCVDILYGIGSQISLAVCGQAAVISEHFPCRSEPLQEAVTPAVENDVINLEEDNKQNYK